MEKKRVLVFASGTKDGGGSGFEFLAQLCQEGTLNATVVAVVSQNAHGGVNRIAHGRRIPFFPFRSQGDYARAVRRYKPDLIVLLGWTRKTEGLDPRITVNVHPASLPRFGGTGMYGAAVHEAVLEAFRTGEVTHTHVCMHFVVDQYDRGPVFFRQRIPILAGDTPLVLQEAIKEFERAALRTMLPRLLRGDILWDGFGRVVVRKNPRLRVVA